MDFNYGNSTIASSGGFNPVKKNAPVDVRTVVNTYAEIASIPNPYVGLTITVKVDETNSNKMTDYKVISLKANALGMADSVVNEVKRMNEYLEVSGSNGSSVDLSDFATKEYVDEALEDVDASSLNGKKFSEPMSKEEYNAIGTKDPNTIYLVDDDTAIEGLPSYSANDANKSLTVSSDGSSISWTNVSADLTDYYTKAEVEELIDEIPTSGGVDLSNYATKSELSSYASKSELTSYVKTSEIAGYVEDVLDGATLTSKERVAWVSNAYNGDYDAIEIVSGESVDITFSIPQYTTRHNFYLTCSTNDITFSGSGYANNGFSFFSPTPLSKTVTLTAVSNITEKRYTYLYVCPYDEIAAPLYEVYKIRIIISPNTGVTNTYGDIVVTNSTDSVNEGTSFTYSVKLSQAPTNNQTVYIETTNNDVTVNPTSLTFTPSNYGTNQTVNVTVAKDGDAINDDCQITMSSYSVSSQSFNIQITDVDTAKTLDSITATYTQGSQVVYPSSSLDALKSNLVVKANYSDSTQDTITSYQLSGALSVGNSTVTVTYQGKTATFNVNVTAEPTLSSISATYNQGSVVVYPDTDVNSLKSNLTVTAHYSDGNSTAISNYTLSGALTVGTSIVTVAYQGKETTFNVTVTERASSGGDITDGLVFHIDGRDVAQGSNQAYWTNKVDGASVPQYAIETQIGANMNTGWNNTSKSYGWLGDSFRYFFSGTAQPQVTISEITNDYTVCIGFLHEELTGYFNEDPRGLFELRNSNSGSGNVHLQTFKTNGDVGISFGNTSTADLFRLNSNFTITKPEAPAVAHLCVSVNFTSNEVQEYYNGSLKATDSFAEPYVNPRNLFKLVTKQYVAPLRIYYVRIYNKALSSDEVLTLYNEEVLVSRGVD